MSAVNQYKHLIAYDLSSYGAAFAIINQFVDDEAVKVFEVSPCGQTAILILLSKEPISLQIIKSEVASIFGSQVLSCALIENIHEDLLPTYLSQNKSTLRKTLAILEGPSIANGFVLAQRALEKKNTLIDFRVIRTFPKNILLTISAESLGQLINPDGFDFKQTNFDSIQPSLKSFYEIKST